MKKIILVIFLMLFLTLSGCKKDQIVKVNFETNGGTIIGEVTSLDDLINEIPETTKNGYTFDRWYLDEALTQAFNPLDERDSWVFTLYAKWVANDKDYTVEHYKEDLEGIYQLFETDELTGKTDQVIQAIPKTYEGFQLDTEHDDAISSLTLSVSGKSVLKLYYERNVFQVIIDEAGGSPVLDLSLKYGQMIELPTLTRFGYTFKSWSAYPETMPDENITVTASWTELPQFDVTFNSNGGQSVDDQLIYQGYMASEPQTPTKEGYQFIGWFLEDANTAFLFTTPITSSIILYARYQPVEVNYDTKIYLEQLDGTYELSQTIKSQGLTESIITQSYPVVDGFQANTSHVETKITGTITGDGLLELKLYYTRNTYTIQFESNANLSIQSISALYESPISQPQDPIRNGYTFEGWYIEEDLQTLYTFSLMPLGGMTLYAKWVGEATSLYFNSNGGSEVPTIVAPLDSTISQPQDPEKPGYTFNGWYSNSVLTEPFSTWIMPFGGVTLYAKWTPSMYTISFVENGGTEVFDITGSYLSPVNSPVAPTKVDYIFVGWCSDEELQHMYQFQTMPLEGITLYAKWVSKDEGLPLSHIITMDPFTSVSVEGLVFEATNPYHGFYMTDGTANIYVLYDQTLVTEGLSYGFDAILVVIDGIPMLTHVSQIEEISDIHSLTSEVSMSIQAIKNLNDHMLPYAVEVTGILRDLQGYVLLDTVTAEEIRITDQFSLLQIEEALNNQVTVKAILHQYDGEWILAVYDMEIVPLTNQDKSNLVKAYITANYQSSYEGMDQLEFLMEDPWGFSSIVMSFNTADEELYDFDYSGFIAVTETHHIIMDITISIELETFMHTINYDLIPRHYQTISEVLDGEFNQTYSINGIIVMSENEEGVFVIKDETGTLFITGDINLNYGDEVALTIQLIEMNTMLIGLYVDELYVQILSENNELNHLADEMTIEEFSALDITEMSLFGKYVELRGYLSCYLSDNYEEKYVISKDQIQIPIEPLGYQGFELLYEYSNIEVIIKGYLALTDDQRLTLIYLGQRNEIQIPDFTDLERVEMILEDFSRTYTQSYIQSFEPFIMPEHHRILGGNITWAFVEGEEYYDSINQRFNFVNEEKLIKIQIQIEHHGVLRTYLYQTTLVGPEVLTISEFKVVNNYESAFVEGIVVYRNPQRMYIQDETGLLLVDEYDCDAYPGDHVVLYGYVVYDYQFEANASLSHLSESPNRIPLVVSILERDIIYSIEEDTLEISDILKLDPNLASTYHHMIETSGYLSYDSGKFTLTSPDGSINIRAIDEYTQYKLALYHQHQITISLILERNNLGKYQFLYLGISGDIEDKFYTLQEKQDEMKAYIDSIWSSPILSGTSRNLPSTYVPFNGDYAYEIPEEYQSKFDINFGYVYPSEVTMTIPLTVIITVDDISIEYIVSISVVLSEEETILNINQAKQKLDEIVTIEGYMHASFDFNEDVDGMLFYDGNEYVIVKLPYQNYFYGGNEIGRKFELTGKMTYVNTRFIFECFNLKVTSFDGAPTLIEESISIEDLMTRDHSHDAFLGKYVLVTGTVEKVSQESYNIVSGNNHIRIQTVYYGESDLNQYVGFKITLKAFVLGYTTYDGSNQIALIYGYSSYGGSLAVSLNESSDQEIVDKLMEFFISNRIDKPYMEGERISLSTTHPLFNSAVITYTPLAYGELLEQRDYEYIVKHSNEDVIIPIRLSVSYGEVTSSYIFEILIIGFEYDTLDDLFDETVPFDDIELEATIVFSNFYYTYFLIDQKIYYHEGPLGVFNNRGQVVILSGKKAIIDGDINYTYHVSYQELEMFNEVILTPRTITINDLYTNDLSEDDIRQDYLKVYGKLGYDSYLNYFYLDDLEKRIYIRHSLRDAEAWSYQGPKLRKDDVSKDALFRYLDDYVYMNLLFPNKNILDDYLLLDFIGTLDDISIPTWTAEEKVNITKDKIDLRYNHLVYHPGEYTDWMTEDVIQGTGITYQLVVSNPGAIKMEDWSTQILAVDTYQSIDIRATILYVDSITLEETSVETIFTIHIEPIESVTVREVLFGNIGDFYVTKGIIQYIYPNNYLILEDESGSIYVDISDDDGVVNLNIGDEIEVFGVRLHYEFEDYIPVMGYVAEINIISTDHIVSRTPITMTVEDILALDYLDPDIFNQYISFTGEVIFSGNLFGYPAYDLREDGFNDETYDLQIYGNTYDPFNDMMDPLVGETITVHGYLIGFYYIYSPFDWMLSVHQVIS